MRAIVQRVNKATLSVNNKVVSKIGNGLLIFLGVGLDDNIEKTQILAKKIASLRVFRDQNDKMNLSVKDVGGEIMVVSNFTIYADCTRGNRPNFSNAMQPTLANEIYIDFINKIKELSIPVSSGIFGEHMHIEVENDGPINIILEI